jgi:acetyl-CoA synthetase
MAVKVDEASLRTHAAVVADYAVADGFRGGAFEKALNACVECCDRHAESGRVALDCVDAAGVHRSYTFAELRDRSAQVANVLVSLGIQPGDVVAGLLPRTADLVATVLGVWRAGAVYQPLFTAFGPKAIEHRLKLCASKLVVTTPQHRKKLDDVDDGPPVAIVQCTDDGVGNDLDFQQLLDAASEEFVPVVRQPDDLFLMMSTSGTTGPAKGVPVPLRALGAFDAYMRYAVDLRATDRFWNIADPGWAYGLYYAVIGPLLLGHQTTLYEGTFSADALLQIVERLGITSLAGSPTAFRLLMAAGDEAVGRLRGQLRVVSSAGEPLNPEVIRWFERVLDAPIFDHYGQTELGMAVNNHHGLLHPVRVGSAGLAMPGYRVVVLGSSNEEMPADVPGELAVDVLRSPLLWFTGYWNQSTPSLSGGYYRTGDMVEMAQNGSVSFIGRADDVITSSGYRIGPFDVESALLEHPAVAESAVIGVPDAQRTEIVKAVVVLKPGVAANSELADELSLHVKTRLSAHAYPRLVEFVEALPKTPSGKTQRYLLREAASQAGILAS